MEKLKTTKYLLILLSCMSFISSCVSYKASYLDDWKRLNPIDDPYYIMYLIGDAGYAPMGESTLVFEHLKAQLDEESSSSAIVWLGDNIYPVGLAPVTSVYHPEGRHRLMAQLETMTNYQGQKFFVPGNHDWYTYGRIGLRRQELMVDSFLLDTPNPNTQSNFFRPDKGCGDPETIVLKEGISLLTMDSHWFLEENARSGDQSPCSVSTQEEFLDKLSSEIERSADNSLIIASHHPPYTYSRHGGKYSFKDHLFPLTQLKPKLYIPLPLIGFIFNKMRGKLTTQDTNNPLYKVYREKIINSLIDKGSGIIASGHEHTLQLIEQHNQYFVVSGAGTKNNKVGVGKGSQFAIGEKGYVKLIFKDPKNVIMQFVVPGHYRNNNNIAYEKAITLK